MINVKYQPEYYKLKTHPTLPWTSQREPCHCCQTAGSPADRRRPAVSAEQTVWPVSFNSKLMSVPWRTCRCLRAATLYSPCHKADTWLCRPHKPLFYKTVSAAITEKMLYNGPRTDGNWRTSLHEWWGAEEAEAVEEDDGPYESWRDEEVCVPAQPQKVQGHLLPKVVPDVRTQNTHMVRRQYQYSVQRLCICHFPYKHYWNM